MNHPLHERIGALINNEIFPQHKIIRDPACGGKQHIPLFCLKDIKDKSRKTKYCDVDLLIAKDDRIKVIMEIEESNVKPTQIFGKFLASALATHYIRKEDKYEKANKVLFIQVLDSKELKEKSAKLEQWGNIEDSICKMIPEIRNSRIVQYNIFFPKLPKFEEELTGCIKNFLAKEE